MILNQGLQVVISDDPHSEQPAANLILQVLIELVLAVVVGQVLQICGIERDHGHDAKRVQLDKPKISNHCSSERFEIFLDRTVPPTLERSLQFLMAARTALTSFFRLAWHGGVLMLTSELVVGRVFERFVGRFCGFA